jgi:hypothetical protein
MHKEASVTGLVWLNVPLICLVVVAIVGIPLWLTFKRPESHPDYGEARAHFAAKARRAHIAAVAAEPPAADSVTTARQHAAAQAPVPGRRHSGSGRGTRGHAPAAGQQNRASA